ncbi:MAG: phosphotransferase [Reinekea sp.]|nr:phosphotransferase [Reinekea sp.]
MNKKSKELFTESIKQAILQHVGLFESPCEPLDGFESFIFKVRYKGEPCALRISHSMHRSPVQIRGEIEWLQHLASHQLNVPSVLPFPNGEYLASISDGNGGAFTAVCFSWAEGQHVWTFESSPWSSPLFEQMGHLCGKMHLLAESFEFEHSCSQRPHWYEEPGQNIRQFLPSSDEAIAEKFDRLNHQIRQVHQDKHDYGLIHADFHRGNFFIHGKDITLFDFDDCQYHLFVADIAIAVFYAIPFDRPEGLQQSAVSLFFQSFMRGYLQERPLDRQWCRWIPALLKQREIDLYAQLHQNFDLSDPDAMDRWSQNFLYQRRQRILQGKPVISLNWAQLFDEIADQVVTL